MPFFLPSQDVPLVDIKTGLIDINWYDRLKTLEPLLNGTSKIATFTRVLSVAAGAQSIVGVGFKPRLIAWQTGIAAGVTWSSIGQSDGTTNTCIEDLGATNAYQAAIAGIQRDAAGAFQSFVLTSFDVDGFTITWSKTGAPTATANITALCFR